MPNCPRCGRPLSAPDAPFCAYCGQPVNQPVQNIATPSQPPPYQPQPVPPQAPPASSISGTPPVPPYQPAPPYYPYGQPQMPPPYGVPQYGVPVPGYPVAPYPVATKPVDVTRGALLTAGLIGSALLLVVLLSLALPLRTLINYLIDYRLENFFTGQNVPPGPSFDRVFMIQGFILLTGWAGGAFWFALLRLRQVSAVQVWLEAMGTTLVLMLVGNSLFIMLAFHVFVHLPGIGIFFSANPEIVSYLPLYFNSTFWISNVIAALALGSLGFLFALAFASWSQVRQPGQPSTMVRDYGRVVPATFLVVLFTLLFTSWYGERIDDGIALLSLPLICLSVWGYCDVMRVLRREQPTLFAPQAATPLPGAPAKADAAMPFAITAIVLPGIAALGFFVLPRVAANSIDSSSGTVTQNAGQLLTYGILAVVLMLAALGLAITYLMMLNRNSTHGLRLGLVIGGLVADVASLIAVIWYDHVTYWIQWSAPAPGSYAIQITSSLALPGPGIWLPGVLLIAAIIVLLIALGQEAQPQTNKQ